MLLPHTRNVLELFYYIVSIADLASGSVSDLHEIMRREIMFQIDDRPSVDLLSVYEETPSSRDFRTSHSSVRHSPV